MALSPRAIRRNAALYFVDELGVTFCRSCLVIESEAGRVTATSRTTFRPSRKQSDLNQEKGSWMFTAYVIVTMLATAFNAYAAYVDFARAEWVIANMTRYSIPRSWLFSLGALKALGAVGLLIGISVPSIGVAASLGLALYFMGAIVTVV